MDIDKEISKAHLNTSGWKLSSHFSSNPIEALASFYLIDPVNQKVAMATASKEAFESIPVNDEAESFAGMVRDSFKNNPDNLPPDICGPLVGYIKATKVYHLWLKQKTPGERMHVLLMMYPSAIRPAITPWHGTVIDPESLQHLTAQIMAADKTRHPEWFN